MSASLVPIVTYASLLPEDADPPDQPTDVVLVGNLAVETLVRALARQAADAYCDELWGRA
jgi:hypothetical protein